VGPEISGHRDESWRRNWQHVVPFFAFPEAVRRIIYTTDEMDKQSLPVA